ncbi:MAG: hypothetical protein ACTHKT_13105 [Solirubrobacterales bacterium]
MRNLRKLPFLLVLLLLSLMLLAAAASAHALTLPAPAQVPPFAAAAADEEGEDESEAEEGDEAEEANACESEDEEAEERCEEEQAETEEAEECVLEDGDASFVIAPDSGEVRLTVHYKAFAPTPVTVDASLHGGKGKLHLGSDHTRFHHSGVFHDTFALGAKQMAKALAAREFEVDLHATGTPADCGLSLATRARHRAK